MFFVPLVYFCVVEGTVGWDEWEDDDDDDDGGGGGVDSH